ncbi:related to nicotinic acid mononucleotide adenylyltransferase [Cephalotrichum gorgonifer]|uniref:Nicotinamide-nucleotide adenylyltransferase n=1 Tax=Cephalotrichum gorgonifer TaxID=2041049 RepID=A0AAE8N4J4_9PEZI|nr:related to nicotinic acid mononucleotide adenylyltransferase [Cephalotrichum gorgonifer]
MTRETYQFPSHRLRRQLKEPNKTPLVLVACGSFSPITFLHLRMFPMAADYCKHSNSEYEVVGGYLSPVSDGYKKAGLAPGYHRVRMCELAVEHSQFIMVDPYEAVSPDYIPTAKVLDHFEQELDRVLGEGILSADGKTRLKPRIALLAGADLIQTMSQPDVWSSEDLEHILGRFGAFIVERAGTDIHHALSSLQRWRQNIHVIQQVFQNNMSSTQIRLHIKRDMSVRYLIPDPVIDYIEKTGLYQERPPSKEATPEPSKS